MLPNGPYARPPCRAYLALHRGEGVRTIACGRGTADGQQPGHSVPPIQQARWRRCDPSFRLPATMAADQLPVGFGHPQEARGLATEQARCQNWPVATRRGRFLDQHVHRTM
jgi:hypothetical protein